ncbi:MAG: fused MFS/spermidine synthase [Candidatus Adiutrix sp.]|jgi:spermidine synthase|nr:fused MFS/spermidine synthase [Candidatus Adiutrix sp.]
MSIRLLKTLAAGFRAPNLPEPGAAAAETVFEGDSPFHQIVIRDEGGRRTLYFIGPEGEEAETSIDLAEPDRDVFEYPGLMLSALALTSGRRVLLIGLGGGYLPGLFGRYLPEHALTVVEVDPLVAELAGVYFGFAPAPNVRLIVADGRDFLADQPGGAFDQIWLDAFSGNYVPARLSGLEFLSLCRDRLAPGGLLVQNFHQSRPRAFQDQLKTTQAAFGPFLALEGRRCGNAVVMARRPNGPDDPPVWRSAALLAAVKKFGPRLGPYDLTADIRKIKTFKLEPEARVIP